MFKRSAKKWNELRNVANALEEHIVKPARSQGTRWLDHRMRALKALDRNYVSLCTQFEDWASGMRRDVTAADAAKLKGYLKKLRSHKFVIHMAAYQDILEDLSALSRALQADDMPVTAVRGTVEAALEALQGKLDAHGHYVRNAMADVRRDDDNECWKYREITIATSDQVLPQFNNAFKATLRSILNCTETRFKSFSEDEVLLAAEVFDPANFPTENEKLPTYGVKEIGVLTKHFAEVIESQGCEIGAVDREWAQLKHHIFRYCKGESFHGLWKKIFNQNKHLFPNVLHLVHIILIMPVATAHVERQFSIIKRILGDWRLSLSLESIEALLRICADGPSTEDFDPAPAVAHWYSSTVRYPDATPLQNRSTYLGSSLDLHLSVSADATPEVLFVEEA